MVRKGDVYGFLIEHYARLAGAEEEATDIEGESGGVVINSFSSELQNCDGDSKYKRYLYKFHTLLLNTVV